MLSVPVLSKCDYRFHIGTSICILQSLTSYLTYTPFAPIIKAEISLPGFTSTSIPFLLSVVILKTSVLPSRVIEMLSPMFAFGITLTVIVPSVPTSLQVYHLSTPATGTA